MKSSEKMVQIYVRLIALSLCSLVLGCAPVKDEHELLGIYRLNLPNGAETLTLLPNGKCVQEIRLKSGEAYTAQGQWRYDRKSEYLSLTGTRISLDGFWRMNSKIAEIPSGGTGSLPVARKLFGELKIGLGEDVYYEKQRQ